MSAMNECDDAHGAAAASALERIDFVNLLNQPRPVGLALRVGWRLVDDDGGRCVVVPFGCSSRAARAGIEALVN
jgi:hypothetical protein